MPISISGSGTITGIIAGGLPDAIITQPELATGVAGTGPAFSAYQSSVQALAANTYTKIQFQTESYDTASAYDNATNYRFKPLVAGYYQVNASLAAGSIVTNVNVSIYKNGSVDSYGSNPVCGSNTISALVYLNGSTDYIEIYGVFASAQNTFNSAPYTYFQAVMVRGA